MNEPATIKALNRFTSSVCVHIVTKNVGAASAAQTDVKAEAEAEVEVGVKVEARADANAEWEQEGLKQRRGSGIRSILPVRPVKRMNQEKGVSAPSFCGSQDPFRPEYDSRFLVRMIRWSSPHPRRPATACAAIRSFQATLAPQAPSH